MKNRNGSYKKILIKQDVLIYHQDYLNHAINQLQKLELSSFAFTAYYILLFLRLRHPKNWLQKNKSSVSKIYQKNEFIDLEKLLFLSLSDWEKEKLKQLDLASLFLEYSLKGIPESVSRAMFFWSQGKYPIVLLDYIPSPRELLKLQCTGRRCLSVLTNPQDIQKLILNARDPLSFVLHDLMHADQFFYHQDIKKAQIGFYNKIETIIDEPELKAQLKIDPTLRNEFEYVASDMNAYVIHLLKCLKSAFTKHQEKFSVNLYLQMLTWWSLNSEMKEAALKINTPHFNDRDEKLIVDFFEAGVPSI